MKSKFDINYFINKTITILVRQENPTGENKVKELPPHLIFATTSEVVVPPPPRINGESSSPRQQNYN